MKAMDVLPSHLRERLGVRQVPLEYIIHDNETPVPIEALATNLITSSNFISLMDELVARTPHKGNDFTEDNAKVFQIIQELVGGSSHKLSI
mmetsp:Transcript_17771/g.25099  ORF Transcript_17771/g.25099 Transcript_17771/m.25099 type:complete len:91 (-) Transcript_17771:2957-3229(-)